MAQDHSDHIVPLHTNPMLKHAAGQKNTKRAMSSTMNTLPFLDDFSKPGPYPDSSKWTDKNVYVNYNLPVCPHTLGVATFDGLDSVGLPYHPGISPYASDSADFLTSRPFQWNILGSTPLAKLNDSIYLSFYYQAGSYFGVDGNGRSSLFYYPKTNDTLKLQFRAADSTNWNTVWYHLGYTPKADTDTVFHLVMIPFNQLTDSVYLRDGFQFRFMNYASCAAADHWSIDEVYLNDNRNYTDTMQNDITFVYDAPSMLANYQAEPWEQYQPGDLRSTPMSIFIRNNNASKNISGLNIINATYNYNINTTPTVTTYSSGANNIDPYVDAGYDPDPLQAQPALTTSNFPATLGSATTYTITHVLQRSSDFDLWNDTLRYNQVFNNYYAYDNGAPDYAYYINPIPGVPSFVAYQFNLNKPDTIFGMQMYFDYVFINTSSYTFIFTLWNDNAGAPGKIIYADTVHSNVSNPFFPKDGNDMFSTYKFQKPQAVGAGKIYVGWEQTGGDSINVGFEFNDNHQNQMFYSVDYQKTWNYSSFKGSMLVRPLVGSPAGPASVNTIDKPKNELTLYPNPSSGKFSIESSEGSGQLSVEVFNLVGEKISPTFTISHSPFTIDLGNVPNGFYLVQIISDKGETSFKKLLISR
jgi:hypothetical protein